eukprot:537728-Prymnesium_polylepis.1
MSSTPPSCSSNCSAERWDSNSHCTSAAPSSNERMRVVTSTALVRAAWCPHLRNLTCAEFHVSSSTSSTARSLAASLSNAKAIFSSLLASSGKGLWTSWRCRTASRPRSGSWSQAYPG